MIYKYCLTVFIVLISLYSFSQDFEKYVRQRQEEFEKYRKGKEDQFKKYDESFKLYVQKRNAEFSRYLEKSWADFKTFAGEKRPDFPKPDNIPVYRGPAGDLKPEKIEPLGIKEIDGGIRQTPDLIMIPKQINPIYTPEINVSFPFYGQEINLWAVPDLFYSQPIEPDEESILKLWQEISVSDYGSLIDQLYVYKDRFNLNDWGYFKLCDATADILANHTINNRKAITWALMNLSGYNVRIGTSNENFYIMLSSLQKLFNTYYMIVDGEKYYILDYNGGNIHTCEQIFDNIINSLDFIFYKPLNLTGNDIKAISPNNVSLKWEIELNKNVLDFYNDYPRVDLSVYLSAPMTPVTRNSLISRFSPQLERRTDREKLEILLHFVQNAFQYKSDMKQFGYEKFFFPDELFYYPFSDCEDRSALFSFLVRWFMGNDVIGVYYPGHLATAVSLPGNINGGYIESNGKNYMICDPTFVNATIGMTMPGYKEINPSIIPVLNFLCRSEEAEKAWSGLMSTGASKTCMQNCGYDDSGNYYIAGNFKGILTVGNKSLSATKNETDAFVACYNNEGIFSWIKKIDTGTYDFINGITVENNVIYFCGNSHNIERKNNQIFIFSLSVNGDVLWNSNLNIDASLIGENINSLYHFTFDGKIVSEKLSYSGSQVMNPGIFASENELMVCFSFSNSLGLRKEDLIVASDSELSIAERLKIEFNKIISTNCEPYTAAVMAVLNLMNFNGMFISGTEICSILEKTDPDLASRISDLIKNFKKVDYIKNENGCISVKTKEGSGVILYKMHFTDKASFKIGIVAGQNIRIDCLSGVMVGNAIIKFPLNYITVNLLKGDFLFDYGKDHSKENVNLKKDILEIQI